MLSYFWYFYFQSIISKHHAFGKFAIDVGGIDTYNAAIAETPWDGAGPRQVTWVMKVTAFERDNWRCVVCGSEGPLELDHARALMNGGDNTLENLHTLCHDCHVAKTRLDFALRRHRQSLSPETLPPDPEAASETLHARESPP